MELMIQGQSLHYYEAGQGYPIVLLHGWGANSQAFTGIIQHLQKSFTVYALDLPGFGQSPAPADIWGTEEYAKCVAEFMKQKGIEKPILLGHSFGGRLCLHLGSWDIPRKIILVDAAGLKPKRSWQYYIKVYSYKMAKRLFMLPVLKNYRQVVLDRFTKNTGSSDYQAAQGVMRPIFVKVVNEDLIDLLPKIKAPTLLIWGDQDQETPLSFARTMEKKIPDAGLVVFPGAGHFSYLDRPNDFAVIINDFLKQERGKEHA